MSPHWVPRGNTVHGPVDQPAIPEAAVAVLAMGKGVSNPDRSHPTDPLMLEAGETVPREHAARLWADFPEFRYSRLLPVDERCEAIEPPLSGWFGDPDPEHPQHLTNDKASKRARDRDEALEAWRERR